MRLEDIIQKEIEITIENYIEEYKEEMHQDTEYNIIMLKARLYLAINNKFYEIRKQIKEIK